MNVKSQTSNAYLAKLHSKYDGVLNYPGGRTAIVVGARPGNIGGRIASHLKDIESPFETVITLDKTVGDDMSMASYCRDIFEGEKPDTLILANGRTRLDWIEDQPIPEIFEVVHDTLVTSMVATKEFVKATIDDPWQKHIVYIGSMAYKSVLNGSAPYCAAKAGLNHFAQCMGWELTPKRYTINVVHPSNVEGTPMTEETIQGLARFRGLDIEDAKEYWGATNLMPRWLNSDDIAEVVRWLITEPAARFLSGSPIELRAGQR